MFEIAIGIIAAGTFAWLIRRNQTRKLGLKNFHWLLIALSCAYSIFVLELIKSFVGEGNPKAALVMGSVFGIVSVISWVLIARFLLTSPKTQ